MKSKQFDEFFFKHTGGGGVVDSGRDVTIFSAISGGVLVTEGTGDSRLFFLIFEFYKINKEIQVTMGKQTEKRKVIRLFPHYS